MRESLAPLASQIRAAFVFGSVAKRKDTASSDIDPMLISDELSYPDVFGALELTFGLGPEVWRVLAKAHEHRDRSEYQGDQVLERRLVTDLLLACAFEAQKVEALAPPAA